MRFADPPGALQHHQAGVHREFRQSKSPRPARGKLVYQKVY